MHKEEEMMKHRGVCILGCLPVKSGGTLPLSGNYMGEKMDGEQQ